MDTFRMFTAPHAVVLATILGLTALAIVIARRGPQPRGPTATERAIGLAYLAAWGTTYVFLLFPPLHEPAKTFPLQLCHWNAVAAALLLATRRELLRPIVYFWGFALSTQALITPSLTEGPAIYPFWFFWATQPEVRTIVDALGPWPERLAIIAPLVAAAMALLLLPWVFGRKHATVPHGLS